MGNIFDNLRNASYKGIPFLVTDSRITFSPRTIIHEYPNSDRIEAQFLSKGTKTFSLEMRFHGEGTEYFSKRKALETALLEPSIGKLIHPHEGEINCAVIGSPALLENNTELGVGKYSVDFIKIDQKIFPTEIANNSAQIQSVRDDVNTSMDAFFTSTFDIIYAEAYAESQSYLESIIDTYNNIVNNLNIANDKISNVKNVITDFSNKILKYLSGNADLSQALLNMVNTLIDVAETPNEQIILWLNAFDSIQDNPIYQIATAPRRQILKNIDAINTILKVGALSNLYNLTPEIDFISTEDVDIYRGKLETRYKLLTEKDTSIDTDYLSITELQDSDIIYNLTLLRSQVEIYLKNIESIVGEIVTIENVQYTNLTEFVHRYYGNLDKYDQILALNNIDDPTQIRGTLKIII